MFKVLREVSWRVGTQWYIWRKRKEDKTGKGDGVKLRRVLYEVLRNINFIF